MSGILALVCSGQGTSGVIVTVINMVMSGTALLFFQSAPTCAPLLMHEQQKMRNFTFSRGWASFCSLFCRWIPDRKTFTQDNPLPQTTISNVWSETLTRCQNGCTYSDKVAKEAPVQTSKSASVTVEGRAVQSLHDTRQEALVTKCTSTQGN